MTNVMYQDLTVKNTLDATSIGAGLIAAIRDALLPVGSVVCCTTSPAGVVGGSWAQIEDKFILAAGTTYAEDSEGGEATHVLTVNELAEHDHMQKLANANYDFNAILHYEGGTGTARGAQVTQNVDYFEDGTGYLMTVTSGENQPHNNMPPYVAKKYWERTA